MIEKLQARPGEPGHNLVTDYFRAVGYLMPNEELTDLPFRFVPMTAEEFKELRNKLAIFERGERAEPAFEPHEEPAPIKGAVAKVLQQAKPAEVPDVAWRIFPMPWGKHAGVTLENLEKNYLFGLWANYEVEREYKGKPKKPETIAKDETFRAMLDLAGAHYLFRKEDEEEPEPFPKDGDVEASERDEPF
jgi:hypothetical protein